MTTSVTDTREVSAASTERESETRECPQLGASVGLHLTHWLDLWHVITTSVTRGTRATRDYQWLKHNVSQFEANKLLKWLVILRPCSPAHSDRAERAIPRLPVSSQWAWEFWNGPPDLTTQSNWRPGQGTGRGNSDPVRQSAPAREEVIRASLSSCARGSLTQRQLSRTRMRAAAACHQQLISQ